MKFFRLDLLTLLISLFILNSCKNQDTIGLGFGAAGVNGSVLIDSNIVANTVTDADSVATSALAKTPLGYFRDPVFGTTEANIASMINLPSQGAYTLPTGTTVVDSAVLVLQYTDGFYGDSIASQYKINVYQLNERVITNSVNVYYNTKQWNYNPSVLLASRTFNARTHTKIKIYNIISGAPDTLITAAAQLRIPFSRDFINNNIFNASTTELGSNVIFQNIVKGIYITLDKNQTTGAGGNFMMAMDSSRVDVYIRTTTVSGSTTTIDTTSIRLPLTAHSAQIKHTYSATINAELSNTTTPAKVLYIQGLAGLRTKISFPGLAAIYNSFGGKIVLNRAELVITPVAGSSIPYKPLPKISLYKYDIAKQRIELEDATSADPLYGGVNVFGGYYSLNRNDYHFIVTGYIQDLMLGKTVDYGTFISAVDTTNKTSVDYAVTAQAAARAILVGNDPAANYKIKLNIIYTRTSK